MNRWKVWALIAGELSDASEDMMTSAELTATDNKLGQYIETLIRFGSSSAVSR